MSKKCVYILWGFLFVLCAALGLVPTTAGWGKTALSVVFFAPPVYLLVKAGKEGDGHTCRLIRNLAALSLGLTALTLMASVAFAMAPEGVGLFLHGVLAVVSSPMLCSGFWALSLFLWACLLMAAGRICKGKQ